MYQDIINNLNTAEVEAGADITSFLSLAEKYYMQGLIVELHSRIDASGVNYELYLMYRPTKDVQIIKRIGKNGIIKDWYVRDNSYIGTNT